LSLVEVEEEVVLVCWQVVAVAELVGFVLALDFR
jgi:hypothetical protein